MSENKNDWKSTVNHFLGREFWNDFQDLFQNQWPAYNLYESETSYLCQIALPGVKSLEEVRISIDPSKLTIKGNAHYHAAGYSIVNEELPKGGFERTIRFQNPIKTTPAEASYKKGIMHICLTKLVGQEISEIIIDEED